jgi:alpha-tubulin suppressor-like RCC1 family protein
VNFASKREISKISCGSLFSFLLTHNGDLIGFGLSDVVGGEGHEFEPKYIFNQELKIIDVACTEYSVACIDEYGRVWSWGAFRVI